MKNISKLAIILLCGMAIMTSCLGDKDEVKTSNNCYISAVKMTNITRSVPGKTAAGNDTIYRTTVSTAGMLFTIDHRNMVVENRDSLPFGVNRNSVVLNITFTGGSMVYRRADAWDDDQWTTYNAADTLDLSSPMHFRVFATDMSYRTYTLKLNAHQEVGDSIVWTEMTSDERLLGYSELHTQACFGRLMAFGRTSLGIDLLERGTGQNDAWTISSTNIPITADISTINTNGNKLFVSTTDGELWESGDAQNWNRLQPSSGLNTRLVAVSENRLYAVVGGILKSSGFNGNFDVVEVMDESIEYFPTENISSDCYVQEDLLNRIILVGSRDASKGDTTGVVWSKTWSTQNEISNEWMFYTPVRENRFPCPNLHPIKVFSYSGVLIVVGGASPDGKHEALDGMYVSMDNGITWQNFFNFHLPNGIKGTQGPVAITLDENNFLWVIAGSKLYRGRLNALGFDRKDSDY